MNDEIKEILEYWKFYINEPSNYKLLNVHFDEIKKVLDYIINLQQENEKLKDNWNYIKKMLKEARQEKYISDYCGTCTDVDIDFLLGKMQELQGSRE